MADGLAAQEGDGNFPPPDNPPEIRAVRASTPIRVDGKLDEAAWQQAEAIIAARKKIVHGAVSMVDQALTELSEKDVVEFDEDKKATMVSNLLVVLCGETEVSPVINTGTLYQ